MKVNKGIASNRYLMPFTPTSNHRLASFTNPMPPTILCQTQNMCIYGSVLFTDNINFCIVMLYSVCCMVELLDVLASQAIKLSSPLSRVALSFL